jgi:hypothetical protein
VINNPFSLSRGFQADVRVSFFSSVFPSSYSFLWLMTTSLQWKYEFVDFLTWTYDVSGSVEIYSQKQIPKDLAGKPDGWNRNLLPPYGIFVLSCFSKQWCIVNWSILIGTDR